MLQGLRIAGRTWLGKVIVVMMFGLLILSFAIWGIGDIFRGYGVNTVARVGTSEISTETVRSAYQNEIQRLSRQFRQAITPERARAFGIDTQVFGRLVSEAALDQRAKALGLALDDAAVAQSILDDPNFRGPSGQFDRNQFNEILRSNGLTEPMFVRDQRAILLRQQLAESLAGGVSVPLVMRDAIHRYNAERRNVGYFTLPETAAGEIAKPDEATLKAFFDERKSTFRAPEYRKLTLLALTPEAIAGVQTVADADARTRYESVKTSRFGQPERRRLEQIVFPTEAEAHAASDRIKAGASFEDIGKERNIEARDLVLGTFAAGELFDEAVRAAAFALPEGAVSDPVAGRFGTVLVRVAAIEPERIKAFEEVAADVKRELALEMAQRAVADVHDRVEDQRASARPLAEIAPGVGLAVRTVEAVDRSGADRAGNPVIGLPEQQALLTAAFASDVGADNEVLRGRDNGYVWFEVSAVEPPRDRPFDEVRAEAERLWWQNEIARRLSEKARSFVAQLDKGSTLAAVAAEAGQPVKTAEGLTRSTNRDEFATGVVAQIFAVNAGKAGSVAVGDGGSRILFKVESATLPPIAAGSPEASQVDNQLRTALNNDLLTEYVAKLQGELGVTVNQQALRNALGTAANTN